MEVTTVSPSPASPTEGDNLCETDVTNVAIHSVTLLICLCGLLGNGAVLCLLSPKRCNTSIFDLAFADFIFLLFTVPSALLFLVEDVSCSPIMPLLYLNFFFQLSLVSCYWVLVRLMFTSNNLNMYKLCKLCCRDLPERLLWLVFSLQFWAFFTLFTVIPAVTNLCPSHQQEHCRAALISMYTLILLLCAAPMVISSTINFIQAKWGSKKQQHKRRDIVIFLMMLFILLLILCNFLQQLGYTVASSQMVFLLNCIHSNIKPFIYILASSLFCLCGLVGNGAVLGLLRLKRCNTGIYRLALADFLFLLFTVPAALLFLVEDVSCSLINPLLYLRFLIVFSLLSCYWALFLLMLGKNIVYMDKLCKLCCCCDLHERLLCLAVSVQFWAFFALFTVIPAVTNLCPPHKQEDCRTALFSMHALILFLCTASVVISSTIKLIKAIRGSQQQQKPKRCDIVLFLIVLFILLLTLCNFLQLFGYTVMSSEALFLLNCIHSSIKPFIYFFAGGFQRPCSLRSLQLSLLRVFEEQEEETAHSNDVPMDTGV